MGGMNVRDIPLATNPNPIVAFEERFAFQKPITLLLKEKAFSFGGDDFNITDINKEPYFKIKRKAFSFSQKKTFYDLYDKPIYNIKHGFFKGYKFYLGAEEQQVIVNVKTLGSFNNTEYQVTFKNRINGMDERLELICDYTGSICGIFNGYAKQGAPLICKITKKYKLFSGGDNYIVEIAPNIDAALMLGLGVCFDEIKND